MAGTRRIIPREELSEFQRWQFSSLLGNQQPDPAPEESAPVPELEPAPQAEPAPVAEPEVEAEEVLPFPTAEEIEAIERQAHEEGYQAGLELGRQEAAGELAVLRELLGRLDEVSRSAEATLASDVLDLSLVIARQLVFRELETDRTLVLNVIREAIAGLPSVKGPARIMLNPDDLQVVVPLLEAELHEDVWRFVADARLASGECRIETPASSVDLTLTGRWQNVLRVLGRESTSDLAWQAAKEVTDDDAA